MSKNSYLFFANGGGLGDAYMALPTLRAFNYKFNNNLVVITYEYLRNLFIDEGFKDFIIYDFKYIQEKHGASFDFDTDPLFRLLDNAEAFIDMNPWYLQSRGYKEYITNCSIPTIGHFHFYSKHLKFVDDNEINNFDNRFSLAKLFDETLKVEDFSYPPKFSDNIQSFTKNLKDKLPKGMLLIGIQDETQAYKQWEPHYFEEVINKLLEKYPNAGILIFSRKTTMRLENIKEKQRVLCFGDSITFKSMGGLLKIVDVFLGIDSVFLHLADMFRVPTITLFGPTSTLSWGIRFAKGKEIISPTGQMKDILPEKVTNEMVSLIDSITE